MLHHQNADGGLDIRFRETDSVRNVREIHENAFKGKTLAVHPFLVLFAEFRHRIPNTLAVVNDNRLRLQPAKIGRVLVHHDFERIFVNLRKHVAFAVGLVFQQNAHEKFGTVLEFSLERKVRLAPFLDVAETAGNEFETLHVNGREHTAKFRAPALCKPEERPRIFRNRVDIAEERVVFATCRPFRGRLHIFCFLLIHFCMSNRGTLP